MQFLGYSFIKDKDAYEYKPPIIEDDIVSISLKGGLFDYLYMSTDTSLTQLDSTFPSWTDGVTIGRTHYDNNSAGIDKFDAELNNIDKILIKRRINNTTSQWETIYSHTINTSSDFKFSFKDYLIRTNCDYQYNIVPVTGSVENPMNNIIDVHADYYGIFITDGSSQYGSEFDIESDYSRKTSSSTVVPINSKYPISVKNGHLNYKSGNVKTRLLLMDDNGNANTDDGYGYRENIVDFLTESPVLVFKNRDGFIGIVSIGDDVGNDSSEYYLAPKTSFTWEQIGDANNIEELKSYGLIRED